MLDPYFESGSEENQSCGRVMAHAAARVHEGTVFFSVRVGACLCV